MNCQRSDREPGHRAPGRGPFPGGEGDPPERSREHGPEHQRHVSDCHPRRGGRGRSRTTCFRPCSAWRRFSPEGGAMGPDDQDRPHAPDGRHPADVWDRSSVASRGSWSCPSSGGTGGGRRSWNCRWAARPWGRASTPIRSSADAWPRSWRKRRALPFVEAANHFEANAQRDGLVACHGHLKTIASTLFNVANNIRWLGSGPRCGFFESPAPLAATGQLDHAGESEPGHVRKHDASGGPCYG